MTPQDVLVDAGIIRPIPSKYCTLRSIALAMSRFTLTVTDLVKFLSCSFSRHMSPWLHLRRTVMVEPLSPYTACCHFVSTATRIAPPIASDLTGLSGPCMHQQCRLQNSRRKVLCCSVEMPLECSSRRRDSVSWGQFSLRRFPLSQRAPQGLILRTNTYPYFPAPSVHHESKRERPIAW
jgi:hypothetical protein